MNITVVGSGYVGLVTGTCLADMGHRVCCHDVDEEKIKGLGDGHIPIYEPGLEELVRNNIAAKRLSFTTNLPCALADAEVCFIAVGTPPNEDGSADVELVLGVAREIARTATKPLTVAVKSTVPVGSCERVKNVIQQEQDSVDHHFDFQVVSNPEFLKEGMAVHDFMRPDRIVVGADSDAAAQVMQSVYRSFVRNGHPLLVMDVRSAEMTKYAANVMLAARISMMNEIAQICAQVGADVTHVRKGVGTDHRLGMSFLYAGIGYGGSCFPKDVSALRSMAQSVGVEGTMLDAVEKVNHAQKLWLAHEIIHTMGPGLHGKRIAVWGLSFKPKTDDIREAPALVIIRKLVAAGAEIVAHDPQAMPNAQAALRDASHVSFADSAMEAVQGADALVLATEWGVYRNPDFSELKTAMRGTYIFDGRNQYDPREVRGHGFDYTCIGRPTA